MKSWIVALILGMSWVCLAADEIRVAIADLGFGATTNEFGVMSDPAVFETALKGVASVRRVPGQSLHDPAAFSRASADVLVVPCGAAWPADAASNLVAFVQSGGSLFTCGGMAFDVPVVWQDGRWQSLAELRERRIVRASRPVPLPPPSHWYQGNDGESRTTLETDPKAPDGQGVCFRLPRLHLWAVAQTPIDPELAKGANLVSFYVRPLTPASRHFLFELHEKDEARSRARVEVPPQGGWVNLTPADFVRNTPDGKVFERGVGVDFSKAVKVVIAFSAEVVASTGSYGVGFHSLAFGTDDSPLRQMTVPQINTRYGKIDDCIRPTPTQIGCFDACFRLRQTAGARMTSWGREFLPEVTLAGPLEGFAAVAQLGLNGHGYDENRASIRTFCESLDARGRPRGPVGSLVRHVQGAFAGSSWVLFGVTNRDLFAADSPAVAWIAPLVLKLTERTTLSHTRAEWLCYRRGETARILSRVTNQSDREATARVNLRLTDREGSRLAAFETACKLAPHERKDVAFEWTVPGSAPDFVRIWSALEVGGKRQDVEPNAFVVWTPSVVTNGPTIARQGSLLAVDGETRFIAGAQNYWGQKLCHTASSPLAFDRDFRQMRQFGLKIVRCFIPPFESEADRRLSDMIVQLAQKHHLVLYHSAQAVNVAAVGEERARIADYFAEVAERYRDVRGLAIDLRNEPDLKRPPSRESAEALEGWTRTCAEAIRAVDANRLVSMGWSQGWAGDGSSKDPLIASRSLDFTDRHFYGTPDGRMPPDFKDVDQRAEGKPLILGECGSKEHPTFYRLIANNGDTPETYARKFRYLASHVFGLGGSGILAWHWRDPIEGIFPCGQLYSTGVPRLSAEQYAAMARAFGEVRLKENPPDVLVALAEEPRMRPDRERFAYLQRREAIDGVLLKLGANWGRVNWDGQTEPQLAGVKVVLHPEDFAGLSEAELTAAIARRLAMAGCSLARQQGDPEGVDIMRVPGEGETAWVVWNGGERAVTFSRGGKALQIPAEGVGLIRVATSGQLVSFCTIPAAD